MYISSPNTQGGYGGFLELGEGVIEGKKRKALMMGCEAGAAAAKLVLLHFEWICKNVLRDVGLGAHSCGLYSREINLTLI